MPTLVFDATCSTVIQTTDYGCSIGSLCWCLNSMGVGIDQATLSSFMVPSLVSPDLGLLDGSGSGLVELLANRWGLNAASQNPISYDEVCARAGKQPLIMGGHNWSLNGVGHWVGVRGIGGDGLLLANPGGTGPVYGQQSLGREAFNARGPFSAVWVVVDGMATTPMPTNAANYCVSNTGGEGANLRAAPDASSSVVAALAEGSSVSADAHAWRHVQDADSNAGWVANEYIALHPNGAVIASTGGQGANLRSSPDASAAIILLLPEGAQVQAHAHAWRHVSVQGGSQGWVAEEFVTPTPAN